MRDLLPQHIDVTWGVLVAGPVFLAIFVCTVLWVYSKKRKALYEEVEKLPLSED